MGPVPPNRVWLPIYPLGEMVVVTDERRSLYAERFSARTRAGGWLLTPAPTAGPAWLLEMLARTHRAVQSVASPGWRATYYEYTGK